MPLPTPKSILTYVLCLAFFWANAQKTPDPVIKYDNTQQKIFITGIVPPTKAEGAQNNPYWNYFIEFGDGRFQEMGTATSIKYVYEKAGNYNVRLTMDPSYSHQATKTVTKSVKVTNVKGTATRGSNKLGSSQLIRMTLFSDKEVTPKNEVQVVLHHQIPANLNTSDGYLIFFYNNKAEKLKRGNFSFFNYVETRVSGKARKDKGIDYEDMSSISPNARDLLLEKLNKYDKMIAYPIKGIKKGKEYRTFISLKVNNTVSVPFVEKKNRGTENKVNLVAMFIPKNVSLSKDDIVDYRQLDLGAVKDPNRLRIIAPRGYAYYHPINKTQLTYKVEFQNKGDQAASRVDIEIPWEKNLDHTEILIRNLQPRCKICFDNCNTFPSGTSYLKVDTTHVKSQNMLIFSFNNIILHGMGEADVKKKKYTKGWIEFDVRTNRKKVDKNKEKATIYFSDNVGSSDELETGNAKKRWRRNGLELGINFPIAGNLRGFDPNRDKLWDNMGLEIKYQNTALVRGIGIESSLGYEPFNYEYISSTLTDEQVVSIDGPDNAVIAPTAIQVQQERINLDLLTLKAGFNARPTNWVSAHIGGGVILPVSAKGRIRASVENLSTVEESLTVVNVDAPTAEEMLEILDLQERFSILESSNFGLFNKKSEEVLLFSNDISSRFNVGALAYIGVNIGLLDHASLGLQQSIYILPNSYKKQCMKFNQFSASLRINLITLPKLQLPFF